jgi:hypothetical protein
LNENEIEFPGNELNFEFRSDAYDAVSYHTAAAAAAAAKIHILTKLIYSK